MDRFFFYLLGAMAAVLLAAVVVVGYSRSQITAEGSETTVAAEKNAAPEATVTPAPKAWSPTDPEVPSAANPVAPEFASMMPTPVPWTPPNYGKTATVIYPGFTVVYSLALGTPIAVQYAMVQGAKPKTYPSPLKVKTPSPNLIPAAGYARAPMALPKSISLYFGKAAGANTGAMTNVAAMDPGTLAGPWTQLSELELRYASEFKWIEIVAGPIYTDPPTKVGGAIIPAAFYRVYRRAYGDCLAFIVPQGATSTKMEAYLTTIGTVEAASGVTIFANTVSLEARDQKAADVW